MANDEDAFKSLSKEEFSRLTTDEKAAYLARAKRHLQQEMDALNASIDRRRAPTPVELERRASST